MKIKTSKITIQGSEITDILLDTSIGEVKYTPDIDDVLNETINDIYANLGENLLNLSITPFIGLLFNKTFVPASYIVVYTYKEE